MVEPGSLAFVTFVIFCSSSGEWVVEKRLLQQGTKGMGLGTEKTEGANWIKWKMHHAMGDHFSVTTDVTESAPQSGNIRYTVVRQAFKWQQNWQQRGNRLATQWAGWLGSVCRHATARRF